MITVISYPRTNKDWATETFFLYELSSNLLKTNSLYSDLISDGFHLFTDLPFVFLGFSSLICKDGSKLCWTFVKCLLINCSVLIFDEGIAPQHVSQNTHSWESVPQKRATWQTDENSKPCWLNKLVFALTLILSGHKNEKLLRLPFSTAA